MTEAQQIILASASRIRADMLRNAGLTFDIVPANIDEAATKQSFSLQDASPLDLAERLAQEKAVAVSQKMKMAYVIGADSVLAVGDRIFDKPSSRSIAANHLQYLRNRDHELISGAAIALGGDIIWSTVDKAILKMRDFSDAFLENYLDENEEAALNSVGCYHLEDRGVHLFSKIRGDYFTILGLPLLPLLNFLRTEGVLDS